MGLFGMGNSKSESKQQIETLSDNAQRVQSSNVVQGGSKAAAGKGAAYAESGAIQRSNLNTATLAGAKFSNKGSVNITTADPAVAQNAFAAINGLTTSFNSSLGSIMDKVNASAAATAAANTANLDKALAQLAPLAESKQTEGESARNKIVLYIVLGIAAAVAAVFIFRKGR